MTQEPGGVSPFPGLLGPPSPSSNESEELVHNNFQQDHISPQRQKKQSPLASCSSAGRNSPTRSIFPSSLFSPFRLCSQKKKKSTQDDSEALYHKEVLLSNNIELSSSPCSPQSSPEVPPRDISIPSSPQKKIQSQEPVVCTLLDSGLVQDSSDPLSCVQEDPEDLNPTEEDQIILPLTEESSLPPNPAAHSYVQMIVSKLEQSIASSPKKKSQTERDSKKIQEERKAEIAKYSFDNIPDSPENQSVYQKIAFFDSSPVRNAQRKKKDDILPDEERECSENSKDGKKVVLTLPQVKKLRIVSERRSKFKGGGVVEWNGSPSGHERVMREVSSPVSRLGSRMLLIGPGSMERRKKLIIARSASRNNSCRSNASPGDNAAKRAESITRAQLAMMKKDKNKKKKKKKKSYNKIVPLTRRKSLLYKRAESVERRMEKEESKRSIRKPQSIREVREISIECSNIGADGIAFNNAIPHEGLQNTVLDDNRLSFDTTSTNPLLPSIASPPRVFLASALPAPLEAETKTPQREWSVKDEKEPLAPILVVDVQNEEGSCNEEHGEKVGISEEVVHVDEIPTHDTVSICVVPEKNDTEEDQRPLTQRAESNIGTVYYEVQSSCHPTTEYLEIGSAMTQRTAANKSDTMHSAVMFVTAKEGESSRYSNDSSRSQQIGALEAIEELTPNGNPNELNENAIVSLEKPFVAISEQFKRYNTSIKTSLQKTNGIVFSPSRDFKATEHIDDLADSKEEVIKIRQEENEKAELNPQLDRPCDDALSNAPSKEKERHLSEKEDDEERCASESEGSYNEDRAGECAPEDNVVSNENSQDDISISVPLEDDNEVIASEPTEQTQLLQVEDFREEQRRAQEQTQEAIEQTFLAEECSTQADIPMQVDQAEFDQDTHSLALVEDLSRAESLGGNLIEPSNVSSTDSADTQETEDELCDHLEEVEAEQCEKHNEITEEEKKQKENVFFEAKNLESGSLITSSESSISEEDNREVSMVVEDALSPLAEEQLEGEEDVASHSSPSLHNEKETSAAPVSSDTSSEEQYAEDSQSSILAERVQSNEPEVGMIASIKNTEAECNSDANYETLHNQESSLAHLEVLEEEDRPDKREKDENSESISEEPSEAADETHSEQLDNALLTEAMESPVAFEVELEQVNATNNMETSDEIKENPEEPIEVSHPSIEPVNTNDADEASEVDRNEDSQKILAPQEEESSEMEHLLHSENNQNDVGSQFECDKPSNLPQENSEQNDEGVRDLECMSQESDNQGEASFQKPIEEDEQSQVETSNSCPSGTDKGLLHIDSEDGVKDEELQDGSEKDLKVSSQLSHPAASAEQHSLQGMEEVHALTDREPSEHSEQSHDTMSVEDSNLHFDRPETNNALQINESMENLEVMVADHESEDIEDRSFDHEGLVLDKRQDDGLDSPSPTGVEVIGILDNIQSDDEVATEKSKSVEAILVDANASALYTEQGPHDIVRQQLSPSFYELNNPLTSSIIESELADIHDDEQKADKEESEVCGSQLESGQEDLEEMVEIEHVNEDEDLTTEEVEAEEGMGVQKEEAEEGMGVQEEEAEEGMGVPEEEAEEDVEVEEEEDMRMEEEEENSVHSPSQIEIPEYLVLSNPLLLVQASAENTPSNYLQIVFERNQENEEETLLHPAYTTRPSNQPREGESPFASKQCDNEAYMWSSTYRSDNMEKIIVLPKLTSYQQEAPLSIERPANKRRTSRVSLVNTFDQKKVLCNMTFTPSERIGICRPKQPAPMGIGFSIAATVNADLETQMEIDEKRFVKKSLSVEYLSGCDVGESLTNHVVPVKKSISIELSLNTNPNYYIQQRRNALVEQTSTISIPLSPIVLETENRQVTGNSASSISVPHIAPSVEADWSPSVMSIQPADQPASKKGSSIVTEVTTRKGENHHRKEEEDNHFSIEQKSLLPLSVHHSQATGSQKVKLAFGDKAASSYVKVSNRTNSPCVSCPRLNAPTVGLTNEKDEKHLFSQRQGVSNRFHEGAKEGSVDGADNLKNEGRGEYRGRKLEPERRAEQRMGVKEKRDVGEVDGGATRKACPNNQEEEKIVSTCEQVNRSKRLRSPIRGGDNALYSKNMEPNGRIFFGLDGASYRSSAARSYAHSCTVSMFQHSMKG